MNPNIDLANWKFSPFFALMFLLEIARVGRLGSGFAGIILLFTLPLIFASIFATSMARGTGVGVFFGFMGIAGLVGFLWLFLTWNDGFNASCSGNLVGSGCDAGLNRTLALTELVLLALGEIHQLWINLKNAKAHNRSFS